MKTKLLFIVLSISFLHAFSQNFTKVKTDTTDDVVFLENHMPSQYQLYAIDLENIQEALQLVASRKNSAIDASETVLNFPNEQGEMESYKMLEWSIMSDVLAAKYPMIKTYVGKSKANTSLTMSIGTDGLHLMFTRPGKSTMFLDPYTRDRSKYILYTATNLPAVSGEFACDFNNEDNGMQARSASNTTLSNDGKLRDYRLAVACTIEYASFHLNNQGISGSASLATKKAAVLSAITNTVNRVKGVYVLELGVTMTFVDNEDALIFIDSDSFTNNSASALIDESQTVITNVIGTANYDVGHTFSTSAGGVAILGGICWTNYKAMAVTGIYQPIGDKYDIDYVAHEMGHHFGANHTFNTNTGTNSCGAQRNTPTAAEPGGGSTIMAYAGICGAAPNVQNRSDAYFHYYSLKEIYERITSSSEPTCGTETDFSNNAPTAIAGTNVTIPKGTAYILEGESTDADGDNILYCWEQTDTQQGSDPPQATTIMQTPLYRSLMPTEAANRYMPKFSTIVGGNISSTWEVTPTVGRLMHFQLVTRDYNNDVGQTNSDAKTVTVSGVAGPFMVNSQSSNETWVGGETKTITWDVAGTDVNGVNATNVIISMVDLDGTQLAIINASTSNDGSENITVPNVNNTSVRIMVRAVDNIFYAINSANISVSFVAGINDINGFNNFVLSPNPNNGNFSISLQSNSTNNLTIAVYDMIGRNVYNKEFMNNQLEFSQKIQLNKVQAGIYFVNISDGVRFNSQKIIIQ